MEWMEEVQSWIRWARDKLPVEGDVPFIHDDSWSHDLYLAPWYEKLSAGLIQYDEIPEVPSDWEIPWRWSFDDEFDRSDKGKDDLLGCFREVIDNNPFDLPARFVALSVYYSLAHYESIYKEDVVSEARARHEKTLAHLVRLLPVERCNEWGRVRWEISNSCAITDWERALRLYNRATDLALIDRKQISLFRGQFHFIRVFRDEILNSSRRRIPETLSQLPQFPGVDHQHMVPFYAKQAALKLWEPSAHETGPSIGDIGTDLFQVSLILPYKGRTLNNSYLDMLSDAARDFEKARGNGANIAPLYQAMLAICYCAASRSLDAAKEYAQLLGCVIPQGWRYMEPRIYLSAAMSYLRAGKVEKAQELAELGLQKYPESAELHLHMAELHAKQEEFQAAYESLLKALEFNPKASENPAISIGIAFGKSVDSPQMISALVKQTLRAKPEISSLADSILKIYWGSFSKLSDQAREEWITGSCLMYYFASQEPEQRKRLYESAVKCFGKAVEIEVRRGVFFRFRDEIRKEFAGNLPVEEKSESSTSMQYFRRFLKDEGTLNLEKMLGILNNCGKSRVLLGKRLHDWLRQELPKFAAMIWLLNDIRQPYGDAKHEDMSPEIAETVAARCRQAIDSLH